MLIQIYFRTLPKYIMRGTTMKNQYFLKDKKCQPIKRVNGRKYYMTPNPIWCFSKQLSHDYELEESGIFVARGTRLFVLNNNIINNKLNIILELKDFILYRKIFYELNRIDTKDDYNTDVFIYAEYSSFAAYNSKTEIMPYGELLKIYSSNKV